MTEFKRQKLRSPAENRALVQASLRSRYRRERRFQGYGIAAILGQCRVRVVLLCHHRVAGTQRIFSDLRTTGYSFRSRDY